MLTHYGLFRELEQIMKQALTTAGLVGVVVFMAGVIWGWWYALLLAFMILLVLNLIEMARK
jgi:uncharacterized protein (DUF58 family)